MCGFIHLIYGPMYSGKTSELFKLKNRAEIANKRCLLIKYSFDTRYDEKEADNKLFTHEKVSQVAVLSKGRSLNDTLSQYDMKHYDAVFIDEIQFYDDADIVCDRLANLDKEVFISGLQSSFERKPMGKMPELFCISEIHTKLEAVCTVTKKNNACYTYRKTSDSQEEVIGGLETYIPLSRKGWLSKTN